MDSNASAKKTTKMMAILAFFFWSGWGFFINFHKENIHQALLSGITQGIVSSALVVGMTIWIYFLTKKSLSNNLGWWLPIAANVVPIALFSVLVHWSIHTPKILATVSGPLTVCLIYSVLLTKKFRKELLKDRSQDSPEKNKKIA